MADSVKKRCSKAKEVKAANKVELLKSCLDKKDFCGDAAYYSCMRKYFALYPPERNNNSAEEKQKKKNKVDACKGSMKFVPGDVVTGDFFDLLDKLIKRFKFNNTNSKLKLQKIINGQKEQKTLNLKYRATVKSVDDKFITLNFDDYHNFLNKIFGEKKETDLPRLLITLNKNKFNRTTVPQAIIGGANKSHNNIIENKESQLNQLKNISIPFQEFNESDAVKYKPSSAMGHIKKGAHDLWKILVELSKPIINEGRPALSETKTNMGKDEENTIINKTKVYPWTGKLKLRQMLPFDSKQEYIDNMASTGAEPSSFILKLYEIYDNKYHLKLIEDMLDQIKKEKKKSVKDKLFRTKPKGSDTELKLQAFLKQILEHKQYLKERLKGRTTPLSNENKSNADKAVSTSKMQSGGDIDFFKEKNGKLEQKNLEENLKQYEQNFEQNNDSNNSSNDENTPDSNNSSNKVVQQNRSKTTSTFIKKIKKDVYNKEIIGIEKSDNPAIAFWKRIKNFFKISWKFRKMQITILGIIAWACYKFYEKKIYVGINILILAFFLYECFYSSIGDILVAAITVFLTIVLLGTIKGVLNIFSSECESSPDWDPDTNKLLTDRYVVSVLGGILLIMSLRTLCNFVPWLKLDWMLWKISLGIMILQSNILYKGQTLETGINSTASFFFVLSCFNALYQYMIKNDSKKTIGLGDLENFADVLNSSYYMIDDTIEDV